MVRNIPEVSFDHQPGYATELYSNFDWWQEACDLHIPPKLWDELAKQKAEAIEREPTRRTGISVEVGCQTFILAAKGGGGGTEFVLNHDDFIITLASPKRPWPVGWRATAAGLAEHGLQAIRQKVYRTFEKAKMEPKNPEKWVSLVRVDYCWDFYSPTFSSEVSTDMANNFICHSSTKTRGNWVTRGLDDTRTKAQVQTLTIGAVSNCQIQVYDKISEITEMSGKTWMYKLWDRSLEIDKWEDVWRVEVRLGGEFLKSRNLKDPNAFLSNKWQALAEALLNRRLTTPSPSDTNRSRWPVHPLFSAVWQHIENPKEFVPIGRQLTGSRSAMREILVSNLAGTLRALWTITNEATGVAHEKLDAFHDEIKRHMLSDKRHDPKVRRCIDRYALLSEAA